MPTLSNAQLTVKQLELKVDKINGKLQFNENGIFSDPIKAFALGSPIQIDIDQRENKSLINVAGNTSVTEIKQLFGWTETQIGEGESAYDLQLALPSSQVDDPVTVQVNSDLEGVSLQLPGDLTKTKLQRKPSTVIVNLGEDLSLPITVDYNNELKAALALDSNGEIIKSGHIVIGSGSAKQPKSAGT